MDHEPAGGGWSPESHASGGGWRGVLTAAGLLAGAIAFLAWLLRGRAPEAAPMPADGSTGGGEEPQATPSAAPGGGAELLDLWVLRGELRGTLANRGERALSHVSWTMRFVPGYDAENDFGGEEPPVIEVAGSHEGPIAPGASTVVTLGEPPGWYLDVRLHPMQLRARYELVEANGARSSAEQSTRLVLFHVRSERELEEIRQGVLPAGRHRARRRAGCVARRLGWLKRLLSRRGIRRRPVTGLSRYGAPSAPPPGPSVTT